MQCFNLIDRLRELILVLHGIRIGRRGGEAANE